jgi:hypothetical protein
MHASENVVDRLVQFMYRTEVRIDICVDNTRKNTDHNEPHVRVEPKNMGGG